MSMADDNIPFYYASSINVLMTDFAPYEDAEAEVAASTINIRSGGSGNIFSTFLGFAFALLIVVGLAYICLRLVGRFRGGNIKQDRNLKMVEALGVGVQSTIQLIKVGDKFFLIGVSRGNITMLGEVDADSIKTEAKNLPYVPFDKVLAKFIPKKKEDGDGSPN